MKKNRYGKYIDINKLKKPVLSDLNEHLEKIKNLTSYLAKNETPINQDICYICKCSKRNKLFSVYGFDYVSCVGCNHVYTTQRYNDDAIKNFYSTNKYWAEVTYANKETYIYRKNDVAKPKVDFLLEISKFTKKKHWLDIGSGIGDIVSVAQDYGWNATGLELSETSVKFALEYFNVSLERKTLEEYYSRNKDNLKFQVISMIGLLEHVVNPIEILGLTHKMLEEDGMIMIQVPNANSLATHIQECFPENVFRHMSPIEHIMVFTENSLKIALEKTGFKPVSFWYHGLDIYEMINNFSLINTKIPESKFYKIMVDCLNEMQYIIDEKKFSDRIIVIAQKK